MAAEVTAAAKATSLSTYKAMEKAIREEHFKNVQRTYEDSFKKLKRAFEVESKQVEEIATSSGTYLAQYELRAGKILSYPSYAEIDKFEPDFTQNREKEKHEIKRNYQLILFARLKAEILCDIVESELSNFETEAYNTDINKQDNLRCIAEMKGFLKQLENIQKVFSRNIPLLRGVATVLIHAIDTGKPIGMGLWTGWNPLKQDYTDRYSLDKLVDQDPLGEYTLCRTAPSPTTSTETETSSSPSKIEESSSDRESPVHSDLPQLVQESVAADNLPPAEGSRTYASVVPPKPPKEDSLSQKDSPTTETQGGLRQRQRSPFKKNSEQPPAKATT